ncbi:hypothetical protein EDB89DRAFT_2035895 [Lactarius sanguifluus]|nr:hypothetical protein EDB89DRAFT_2035895 [Lactarius sanguifluus]
MVSQAILGLRAYTISRKNRTVGIVLFSGFIFASAVEWLSNVYHRIRTCGTATLHPTHIFSTWLFYLVGMLYDLLTLSISMGYLFKYHPSSPFRRFHYRMIYDGLGYFVALTVVNTINAILFRTHNSFIQVRSVTFTLSPAPWGGVATWIMSQRILINLQGVAAERLSAESPQYVYRSTHTPSARDRSSSGIHHIERDGTEQVQVRVDRSVVVGMVPCDWKAAPCDEPFRTPAVKWYEGLV